MTTKKEIAELTKAISESYGGGSLMMLGDSPQVLKNQIDRVPTGYYNVDWILSGGLVRGGQVEIFGNEGDGKTTLALTILGHCQKLGMQAYFLDAEHKLNILYAQKLGVDTNKLLLTQPISGENGLDIAQAVLKSGLINVMVVDSVDALVPLSVINGDFTDANMGAHAKLMSKMCRIFTPIASQKKIIITYINQIRQKLGVFFGSPETTTGGKALKFYCGTRLKVSSQQVKKGETVDPTQRNVTITAVKQQWGIPYRHVDMRLILGEGFSHEYDIVEYGLKESILTMSSSSVYFNKKHLGSGKLKAGAMLLSDNKMLSDFNIKLKEVNNEK